MGCGNNKASKQVQHKINTDILQMESQNQSSTHAPSNSFSNIINDLKLSSPSASTVIKNYLKENQQVMRQQEDVAYRNIASKLYDQKLYQDSLTFLQMAISSYKARSVSTNITENLALDYYNQGKLCILIDQNEQAFESLIEAVRMESSEQVIVIEKALSLMLKIVIHQISQMNIQRADEMIIILNDLALELYQESCPILLQFYNNTNKFEKIIQLFKEYGQEDRKMRKINCHKCCEAYKAEQPSLELSCAHSFHTHCLVNSLLTEMACPYCQMKL